MVPGIAYTLSKHWRILVIVVVERKNWKLWNELNTKNTWRFGLEIDDKRVVKGLRACKLETQPGSTWSIPKKKEKLRVLIGNSTFWRRISPALLTSGLVRDGNPRDDGRSGSGMSGGLDT